MTSDEIFCDRCLCQLFPGRGDWFFVDIQAVADPTPPHFEPDEVERDHRAEIEKVLEQLEDYSPQELQDQVYRRVSLTLCGPCFREWIEDPAGSQL